MPAGDVYITLSVAPHRIFDRRGNDIYCEIPISFTDAALGCEMTVPTLDGKIKYNVPEGTQTDSTFRFKGKGVPKLGSKSRGDMYVTVTVEIPKNLTGKQKELLRKFAETVTDKNLEKKTSFFQKLNNMFK